jgi:hypothetical protein
VRVPLDRLLLKANVPAGANYLRGAAFALHYRSTTEDLDPILVREAGDGLWRVLDGRHRFLASVIAGRHDILAQIEVLD